MTIVRAASASVRSTLGSNDALCDDSAEWISECTTSTSDGSVIAATTDAATAGENDENDDDDEEFVYSDDDGDGDEVDWEDVASGASAPPERNIGNNSDAPAAASLVEPASRDDLAHERDSDDASDNDGDEMFEPDDDGEDDNGDGASIDDDGDSDASMDDDNSDSDCEDSAAHRAVTDLQKVDWTQVNQVLQQEAARAAKAASRKRKVVRMTKADKTRELTLHQTHVLLLLATQLKWNALCQSSVLRGLLLSLTSAHSSTFDFYAEAPRQPLAYVLEQLVRWFGQHFRATTADARDSSAAAADGELLTEARLLQVFFDREGRDYELAVLFTALCRALRLYCRHTCALDALLAQHTRAFESSTAASPSGTRSSAAQRKRPRTQSGQSAAASNGGITDSSSIAASSFWVWTEVLDERRRAWVHVDAVRRLVGRPQDVEALRGKGAPFSYVVAVTASERVVDVTPRYASRWSKSLARRIAHDWMGRTLEALNAAAVAMQTRHETAGGIGSSDSSAPHRNVEDENELLAQEQTQLLALAASETMPTSLEGFKKHHVFCLERHLGRFECVHPRRTVGLFKGQRVFLRSHVHVTRSLYDWRRLGREVRAAERQQPAKWYTRGTSSASGNTNASDSDGDSDNNDTTTTDATGLNGPGRALFGEWQTDAFVAPAVVDGVVPRNEFGNVEVWSAAHVPRDGTHVRLPRIAAVAQELGLDFAPALVGFEVRDGRNAPVFDGIVVADSALELLLDAHAHVQQRTIERAIAKNQSIVARRWERLVTRLLLSQRLEDDYGAVGDRSRDAPGAQDCHAASS